MRQFISNMQVLSMQISNLAKKYIQLYSDKKFIYLHSESYILCFNQEIHTILQWICINITFRKSNEQTVQMILTSSTVSHSVCQSKSCFHLGPTSNQKFRIWNPIKTGCVVIQCKANTLHICRPFNYSLFRVLGENNILNRSFIKIPI